MNTIQSRLENPNRSGTFWVGLTVSLLIATALSLPAAAQTDAAAQSTEVGVWAGIVEPDRPEEAIEVGVDVTLGRDLFWGIRPQFGVLATEDNAFYGFAGFRYTFPLSSNRFRIDLSTAAGYYENGDGVDLGHELEFRSGLDLMLALPKGDHLSLAIYHTSNASISNENPGSDTVLLRYVFKLGR